MLKKLLKYNLKNQYKFFGLLYGLILFSAIISRLLSEWAGAPAIIIFTKDFFEGAMWAMIANVLINNMLRVWAEFRRSLYGDESYLMHTLPVKTSTLYWSKAFGAFVILCSNILVSIAGILILYGKPEFFDMIGGILEHISQNSNIPPAFYMILLGGIVFFEILNIIMSGFFAIILGHKHNNNKVAWSVGWGFLIYFIVQTIVIASFAISGIFNSEMFGLFTGSGSSFDPQTTLTLLIESSIIYPVIIVTTGLLSARSLNRGFDID